MVSCFLMMHSRWSCISETEYDPWGRSNSSFQVGADILNLMVLYADSIFIPV